MLILTSYFQTIFTRLYKAGSSFQGGTLLQLRNLINRRNISANIEGKFNEALDFFELVVVAHVLAASMHFFGMSVISDKPSRNALRDTTPNTQWPVLRRAVEKLVDRYVMVGGMSETTPSPISEQTEDYNPHVQRIEAEHNYTAVPLSQRSQASLSEHHRVFPQWLQVVQDEPTATLSIQKKAPDGVLNYASAVLNDGLLLLEVRDAIHEGDGPRLLRCWKLMMMYWRHGGHTKYALETLHLLGAIQATATPRVAHELMWCRFVNNRGGAGNNLPVDLYMEHLNRTLKDYLSNVGANISESSIVRTSESLHALLQISTQFDHSSGIDPVTLHHTRQEYGKDLELILKELVVNSRVFDYVPGRYHQSFKTIKPHITSHIDTNKLMRWIQNHVRKISKSVQLNNLYHP